MNKNEIREYFDSKAELWDAMQRECSSKINTILTLADIKEGDKVLDVACGTGVLFDALLARKADITAVDISPKMCEIAGEKYRNSGIEIINADAEEYEFDTLFDRIIVYNAFPHFISPERLIKKLSTLLNPNGILVIAHSMGREQLQRHHGKIKQDISRELITIEECGDIFSRYLDTEIKLSNNDFYFISGRKQCRKEISGTAS